MYPQIIADALPKDPRAGSLYYRHPRYDLTWWWREFYRVSYVGGREYARPQRLSIDFDYPILPARNVTGQLITPGATWQLASIENRSLLFRHNREQSFEYENRKRRAHYKNPVRTAINSLVSHATKAGVTRDELADPVLSAFWDAPDEKRSMDMDTFMRDPLRLAQTEGLMWCCTDVASDGDGDGKPYSYWVNPLDILDWATDDDGEILWLKQFVYVERQRTPLEPIKPLHRFRIWYPDRVDEYDVEPNPGGTGSATETPTRTRLHDFGAVPFDPLYGVRCQDVDFPDGESLVGDFCKSANSVYNYTSLLNEILYKQTFSWLVIPDKNVDAIQVGTSTVFGYDNGGGSAAPSYISPDAEQARVLIESIAAELEQMRQALGIGRGRQESSMQKSSKGALELESDDKRSILSDIAGEAQDFERRLALRVKGLKAGATKPTMADLPHIQYPREFDLRALSDEIAEATAFQLLSMPQPFMAEVRKALVRRKFPGMPPAQLDELVAGCDDVVDINPADGQLVPQNPNQPGKAGPGKPQPPKTRAMATGAKEPG